MHTVQSAECEDGMPPESTIARMSHTPCLNLLVKICRPIKLCFLSVQTAIRLAVDTLGH